MKRSGIKYPISKSARICQVEKERNDVPCLDTGIGALVGHGRTIYGIRRLLVGFVLASVHFAEAQQATKVPQIGYLDGGPRSAHTSRMEAFRQGLRELGYEEGKTLLLSGDLATAKSILRHLAPLEMCRKFPLVSRRLRPS